VHGDSRPLGDGPRGSAALARALGITRVARLTGLDRTGVEVASAVRPGGHVLQVTNGKGAHFADAARGALLEAAELWGAEHPAAGGALGPCSVAELRARVGPGERVIDPAALAPGPGPAPAEADVRRAWCRARDLSGARAAWVPFDALYCPPPGGPLRPATLRWTSNGMGAHPRRAAALLHALLEAVERDQLARALPDGFTEEAVARRALDPATLDRAAPRAAALAAALRERGFRVHLLDLAPGAAGPSPGDLGLPTAAALLVDEDGGPVPVAAGYACRLGRDGALCAALLEAAQSRATEIHGAREDVAASDRRAAAPLAALLAAARPRRAAGLLPDAGPAAPAASVRRVVARLATAGLGLAAAAELPAPPGLWVMKVIVPGLLVSPLL
jgi:ribosomal protein S12 methylthiotransferase accessory factor